MSQHIPNWYRIEPDTRSVDPSVGAGVPLADPFWTLSQQWWVGEWRGFDGGAPISSEIRPRGAQLSLGEDAYERTTPSQALAEPLEAQGGRAAGDWRTALRLGTEALAEIDRQIAAIEQTLRRTPNIAGNLREMLEAIRRDRATLHDRYPLELPFPADARVPLEQRVDGVTLLHLIASHDEQLLADSEWRRRHAWIVREGLPAPVPAETGLASARLDSEDGSPVAFARDVEEPALHWSDLHMSGAASASFQALDTSQPIPARLSFAGDLSDRWWQLEDAGVDYIAAPTGPSDLGQLLVAAAFAEQGGVWFLLPFEIPGNSLITMEHVIVSDGFGRRTVIEPRQRGEESPFAVGTTQNMPVLANLNEPPLMLSDPVEAVSLVADPADNLIWAITDVAPDAMGRGTPNLPPRPDYAVTQTSYAARIAPPPNWVAYAPGGPGNWRRAVLAPPGVAVPPATNLAPAVLGPSPDASGRPEMHPGMLGPGGRYTEAVWAMTRSVSGHRLLWRTRRQRPGSGRPPSGLLHDQVLVPQL